MKKVLICLLCAVMLVASLAGCTSQPANNTESKESTENVKKEASKTFKLGLSHGKGSEFYLGAEEFKKLVEEKSEGRIKVELYPSGQIGSEGEMTEGITMGSIDAALVGTSSLATVLPSFEIFNLPYLFRDYDHADKVLLGDVGNQFSKLLREKNIQVLSYWESGFRHYVNAKHEVKVPEDLKGLSIRTPQSKLQIAITEKLGASPIAMSFAELYLACQQGVVDGQEGPVFAMVAEKMYEVQKYMVLDGHVYTVMGLIMNPTLFDSFSEEDKQILLDAAKEAGMYERKLLRENEAKHIETLKAEGMIIYENPDKEIWRNAAKAVYDEFQDKLGKDLVDQILNTK